MRNVTVRPSSQPDGPHPRPGLHQRGVPGALPLRLAALLLVDAPVLPRALLAAVGEHLPNKLKVLIKLDGATNFGLVMVMVMTYQPWS